jgi:hypothetical protein
MYLELSTCLFSCKKNERFKITVEVDPLVIHIYIFFFCDAAPQRESSTPYL